MASRSSWAMPVDQLPEGDHQRERTKSCPMRCAIVYIYFASGSARYCKWQEEEVDALIKDGTTEDKPYGYFVP